ncbi:MAG: hypothetical protein BWK76_21790 [Desulfobulbaceae bacterium A2]|nr:MAG: hypothetical protein BWK76_21790 [Desulfobulbaceae bacterium A2]
MKSEVSLRHLLRHRLFVAATLAFVLTGGLVGWRQSQAELDQYARVMQEQLRLIKSLIPVRLLQNTAALQQMVDGLPEGDETVLLAAVRERLRYADPLYYVLDARGRIVQISEGFDNYLGFDPSHMDHLREERPISRVYQSVFSHHSVVALLYPLKHGLRLVHERDVQDLVPLLRHLDKAKVLPEQAFFILSPEGVVVYHADPTLVSTRYNLAFDLKNMSSPDQRGLRHYLYQNKKYYVLQADLEIPQGWTVYMQLPARLLTPVIIKGVAGQLAGMLILVVVITLLFQFVLNHFFSRPVQQLVTALGAYEPGRREPIVAPEISSGVLEFSRIVEAINRMGLAVFEANTRLAGSEEQIRLLLNSTAEAIYGLDAEGKCTFCNDALLRMLGFAGTKELLGRQIHDIIHHSGSTGIHCDMTGCVAHQGYRLGREAHSDNEVFWRADGSSFFAECWSYPLRKDGEITGAVVTLLDISERKQAENALAAEKERLAVTLRSIGDGVITTDIEGRVVLLNVVAEKLTGWKQREAVGRPLGEVFVIVNEKTRLPCENPVEKVLASGQIIGLANHTILVSRDGGERSIADSGAPIHDQESRTIGVVLVFRDVTDQVRVEQERLKLKKLESVGVLAGGISHDFNNILAAILGNLSLAQLDPRIGEETRSLLHAAEKASLRARDLTQQLLTFSKGGEPIKQTASIAEIIRESATFVLHGSSVACRWVIPDDLWLVDIDRGQMSQVIQNIILNAKHAMPQGGEIEVVCENVVDAVVPVEASTMLGRAVRISIRDTGIGIPPSLLDKIFDPYFTTKQEGSGLGLAITHSIIAKHGGHILVRSAPGQGTTFTILLSASPAECEAGKGDVEVSPAGPGNARILLMDDDEMVRDISAAMLRHQGYEVVLAQDGREALALYRQYRHDDRPVDLVVMDLTIPGGMGGKETVREMLALDPAARVVVSSGYSNDPIMADYRQYGFVAAVAKPFQMQEFLGVIRQVLALADRQEG